LKKGGSRIEGDHNGVPAGYQLDELSGNRIAAYHILVKKQTPFEMDSRILEKKNTNKQTNLSKGAFPYIVVICECIHP
jgi:hypothetical protein